MSVKPKMKPALGISGSSVALNPQRALSTMRDPPLATQIVLSQRPARPVKATSSRSSSAAAKTKKPAAPAAVPASRPKTVLEKALEELASDVDPARSGWASVRFNHYRKNFHIKNGVLQFSEIDAEYSFSFVYRGDFKRFIQLDGDEASSLTSDDSMNYFVDVGPDLVYRIVIAEDPVAGVGAEGLRLRDDPLVSSSSSSVCVKENRQVALLTAQLLTLPVDELHSAEARALREARDIEDVLYS